MKPIDKIGNRDPFKVPEGYFESLSERIIEAVREKAEVTEIPTVKKTGFIRIRPYLALAAIVTGLAIISIGVFKLVSKPGDDFITGKNSSVFITEVITEEIDIYTLESEVIESNDNKIDSSGSDDIYENIVIENIEETDIIDLL